MKKGEDAKQVYCPKCDMYQLVPKKGSKACSECGYTRTQEEK
jgi:transposase-like protein